jgi:serine/threonine protein kinase
VVTGAGASKLKVSLSDFSLVKVIGKGSFGKVMLASKRDSRRVYAIKVLSKHVVAARNQVDHTVTERAVLGRIAHPFIVGLKYAFQTEEKLYFVLDFCPGGELFYHLGKEGRFHEGRAKFYTAQILLALEHIHSIGVVYRDLKPENVLLDADGNVKITDFGLSKEGVTLADSGASSFCGTPEYLAPEVLNRTGHGRAVDWWSLGALLFEMLTGWPPFYSADRKELFEQIRHSELDLGDTQHLSEAARDILRRLLHKDPRQRLGCSAADSADIKAHPFFAGVDWGALLRREIPAPWRPAVTGPADTQFFSSEFTDMAVDTDATAADGGQQWGGFSFVARDSSMAARAGVAMPGAAARVAMPVLPAAAAAGEAASTLTQATAAAGMASDSASSSSSSASAAGGAAYATAMASGVHVAAMPMGAARAPGMRILSEDEPGMM